jgi:Rrf2 family transcriptional regulator, cysteine metabolism repressor
LRVSAGRVIPTETLGIAERRLPERRLRGSTLTTTGTPAPHQRHMFHGSGAVSFSTKGEYGVRLMVQLGRHYGTGPASLAEIAAEEDLPRAYLEQLVMSLRDAGLVTSTRGARGGYQLARQPEETKIVDVLRALEGPIAPMICASEDPEHGLQCDRTSSCTVNLLWVRIRDAIAGALDTMTLADLVPTRAILLARAALDLPSLPTIPVAPLPTAATAVVPNSTPSAGALTRP